MDNKISEKESFDFILGQITVLKYAFASLIATHPLKKNIIEILKKIPAYQGKETFSEYGILGIKNILDEIDNLSVVAGLALQAASQKSGGKS